MTGRALWWSVSPQERTVWLSIHVGQERAGAVAGTFVYKLFWSFRIISWLAAL